MFAEINRTGVFVFLLTLLLFLRNIIYPNEVLSTYKIHPIPMNSWFIRISGSYFAAKGNKPFFRALTMNTIAVVFPEALKMLIFKGQVSIVELNFCF